MLLWCIYVVTCSHVVSVHCVFAANSVAYAQDGDMVEDEDDGIEVTHEEGDDDEETADIVSFVLFCFFKHK